LQFEQSCDAGRADVNRASHSTEPSEAKRFHLAILDAREAKPFGLLIGQRITDAGF
jgi:hypothetical protein